MEDIQRAQKYLRFDAYSAELDVLEGKAVTQTDKLDALDVRLALLAGRLALAAEHLEGK